MPRGIDHLVIAVRNLDAARQAWARLGFTLAPTARHPFGTSNTVIQLGGSYLELLAVTDPSAIPAEVPGTFSFAAFNRDFLSRHEGISMLALRSRDAAADRESFQKDDLPVFAPLDFARQATGPDGVSREISFSLAFTREPRLREIGFFTCQHHHPENFWREEYQGHANGAEQVASAVLVARDPADFHAFLAKFTDQHDMTSTSIGLTIDTGEGTVDVLSPIGFRAWFGESPGVDPRRILACRISVADLSHTATHLKEQEVPFLEKAESLIVSPEAATGVFVAFVQKDRDLSGGAATP